MEQVEMVQKDLYELMLFRLPLEMKNRLVLSKMYTSKVKFDNFSLSGEHSSKNR